MDNKSFSVINVEIHGQRYPIRSQLTSTYVTELANYVDTKMTVAEEETKTGDSHRVAVLAALNIADEYFNCRRSDKNTNYELEKRVAAIESILDRALSQATSQPT